MRCLIVNADDFGASEGINRGILDAHRLGIVTSTSLMVNMPGARDAIRLSQEAPRLSVGLHVNFTNEGNNPVVDVGDAEACRNELHRQFHLFRELAGCLPTHLDSHHNIHRQPHLLPHFLHLASRYALPMREHSGVRYFSSFYGQWGDGQTHLEWISPGNLMTMIEGEVRSGVTELACHPGYIDDDFDSSYLTEREAELRTLCDARVRRFLVERRIRLIGFRDFAEIAVCQLA